MKLKKEYSNRNIIRFKLLGASFITLMLISSIIGSIFLTGLEPTRIEDEDNKKDKEDNTYTPLESPNLCGIGDDPWWNASFYYRRLINITNPYSVSLVNTIASIAFNYTQIVNAGKMNSSLKDVRIVENGILRNYLIQKDYPSLTIATVYFETNLTVSLGNNETDTYMYYGNNSVGIASAYYNKNNRFGIDWWKLDDNTGITATDSVGTINGALTNGPQWVTGKLGKALAFVRASTRYVRMSSFSVGNTLVVSGWFQKVGTQDSMMPWGMTRNGGNLDLWFVGGYLYNNIGDSQSNPFRNAALQPVAFPTDGAWHHYVVSNIGGTSAIANLWIDGVLRGNASYRDPTSTNKIFQLSCWPIDNNYHWNGTIDDVRIFNYALTNREVQFLYNGSSVIKTSLSSEREQGANVRIIVRDVDGRLVPGADVSLRNQTQVVSTLTTTTTGEAIFDTIKYGKYNITVNYTSQSGNYEKIIYDSRQNGEELEFKGLFEEKTVYVNIWTIDFEIIDWDNALMNEGSILVYNDTSKTELLANLEINSSGNGTFRWLNSTSYYYEVYYDNPDYKYSPLLLNSSIIYRPSLTTQEFNVNNSAIGSFYVSKYVWAKDSNPSYVGQTRIINATVELKNMNDHLTKVDIFYVDSNIQDVKISSASKTYTVQTQDTIHFFVLDNYNAYGLKVDVYGDNSTMCNGIIKVLYTQTTHQYITVNMSKLTLKVIDTSKGAAIPGVIVRVFNGSAIYKNSIVNLTTGSDGYARGIIKSDLGFWYQRGKYNFTLEFFSEQKNFNVNDTNPSQWKAINTNIYNYTLNQASSIVLEMIIDSSSYLTAFNSSQGDTEVTWGQNMNFQVNLTYTTDGVKYKALTNPDEIECTIYQWGYIPVALLTVQMINRGQGNFTVTINSSLFTAGPTGSNYLVIVRAHKLGYRDPYDAIFPVKIDALPTAGAVHDYLGSLQIVLDNTTSQYYNEKVNITVSYYISDNQNLRLSGAKLDYSWNYGSGSNIGEDPINPSYYTFEINTGLSPSTAKYGITITISLENHTTTRILAYINILPRTTIINGSTTLKHISRALWVIEAYNFTFEYNDTTGTQNNRIGDLETAYYYWYELDEDGNPSTEPTDKIDLIKTVDNLYVLDFNTEDKEVGAYAIFITLQKNNYEARNAFIDLEIKKRTIDYSLSDNFKENKLDIIKGAETEIVIKLKDPTNGDISLEGATVTLVIGDEEFKFKEEKAGVYKYTFSTKEIEAFFTSQTLTGQIVIEKENYETETIDVTIVVEMEEIFPGIPSFYFYMIVGAILAVTISLVSYRQIQKAKIPKFVRKVRKMSKAIDGRQQIQESLLYPTKEEYIVKNLGDKWESLGLNLKDILGIEIKKEKQLPEINKEDFKNREEVSKD